MTIAVPAIAAHGVRIRHDGAARCTPDGADLAVAAGEVVLLLGPSGSGKSTLAFALDGLIPHALPAELEGVVRVSGVDIRESAPGGLSAQVGAMFQHAERVALAMDSRAFGAHPTRAARHLVPFRVRDIVSLVLFLAAIAAILLTNPTLELP